MIDVAGMIKAAVTVPEAARFYGFEPNRAGFICCPFHNEKTPSMKLYQTRYKCFGGCSKSGDVIDFVSQILNIDFKDAVARLNEDFRLGIDLDTPIDRNALRAHRAAQAQRKRQQEILDRRYKRMTDEYRRLRWAKLKKAPRHPSDVPDDEYIEACQRLDYLEWRLEEEMENGRIQQG